MFRPERILIAIDLSVKSDEIIEALNDLEVDKRCTLIGVHVVPDLDAQTSAYLKSGKIADVQKSIEQVASSKMQTLANKKLKGHDRPEVIICKGSPADCILKLARERRVNLIIMGNGDPAETRGTRFGSTADKVVRGASCPVLIVPTHGI